MLDIVEQIPEIMWEHGDDLCDCTFHRIGSWTNPYLGKTLRIRMCCIWKELYKDYPQFVQEIPAYYDENTDSYEIEPAPWDSEDDDMPVHIWHRQVAFVTGKPLAQVRDELAGQSPPKKVRRGTAPPRSPAKTGGKNEQGKGTTED